MSEATSGGLSILSSSDYETTGESAPRGAAPDPADVEWQQFEAGRLVLHVRPYSPAARDVDELAGRYAEALAAVSDALEVDAEALPTIAVYLADLPTDDLPVSTDPQHGAVRVESAAQHELTIWSAYGSEAPSIVAEVELARALLAYGYGVGKPGVRFWDEGLAGYVAARSGRSTYHAEAGAHCRQLLQDGALPPMSELVAESTRRVSAAASSAACAFASFLIERFGLPRYQKLLREARAGRDDPFVAAYSMPLAVADRDWRRHLEATADAEGTALLPTLGRLLPIARPYWRTGVAVLACSLVGVLFSLALPLSFRFLIDNVLARRPLPHGIPFVGPEGHVITSGQEQLDVLVLLMTFLGLLYVANAAARLVMNLLLAVVGESFTLELRRRLVGILDRLPARYFARGTPSDVSQRVVNDVETVQGVITRAAVPMFSGVISILCFAGLLVVLEPKLSLVTLVGLPIVALIHGARRRGRRAAARERVRRMSDLSASVAEAATLQVLAKLYLAGPYLARRLTRRMEVHRELNTAFARESAFLAQSGALVLGLVQVAVLLVGGYLIIASDGQDLAPGSLVAFYIVLNQLLGPIGQVSAASQSIAGASASVERAAALLGEQTEQDRPGAEVVGPLRRELRFDGVSFAYPDGKPVLKGLTLTIQAGTTVAFVGPSGAGKSSIVQLLPLLYAPTRGSIAWDGLDVRQASLASLRRQIGLVPQDAMLLNATVYANIRFGLEECPDERVREAARRAAADELIAALPDGYDTVLGQGGVGLSGGQRQRIALARAILREPSVLILDEATSALDAIGQRTVQERLREDGSGRTIVKVAHRLETVVDADVIFVLDDGRLVEQGSHAELVEMGGLYARLFADQTEPFRATADSSAQLAAHRLQARAPFSTLPAQAIAALGGRLRRVEVPAGAELYRRGDDSDALYVLLRGRVELQFPQASGRDAVDTVEPGGLLGDSSFLARRRRPATASAVADSVLYRLDRAAWDAVAGSAETHASVQTGSGPGEGSYP